MEALSRRRKILFSLTYYHPYSSGLTIYVKRLAEELKRKGCQLSVISCQYRKELKQEEIINGVKSIRAKLLFKISKGFFSIDWIFKCFSQVRNADIVIVNLPQAEGFIPALFAKILGKKVIAIYHCEVQLSYTLMNRIIEVLLNFSNQISCMLADSVVTYTRDFALHSKILPRFFQKTKYIYPPIKISQVNKEVQKRIINKIGGKPDYLIGVAARLAEEKGLEYLFEALPQIKIKDQKSKIKDKDKIIKIIIAGSLDPVGEEKYKEKIFNLVKKYKDHIVFLGELKEEEMGSFYSLLDVLVLPSVNSTESFGMVQVEAMLCGVPVVVSDLPGVRIPIAKTGMGEIVPIKNSQKLAEAIVKILFNKNRYIKPKEFVEQEFAIEKTIAFYEKLFRQLS